MARTFRRRLAARRGAPRRKLVWARFNDTNVAFDTDFASDLLADFRTDYGVVSNMPGTTETRIRMAMQFQLDATGALTESTGVVAGIYVGEIGPTPVSTPATTDQIDWLYWEWIPFTWHTSAAPGDTDRIFARIVDIKSQRKLDEIGQTLYFAYQTTGGITATATWVGSILLKLP